jgi:hypothetical protein
MRDAWRKEVAPEMITDKVAVVEGISDRACLRALDQRIGRLSARRNAYSQAHELAHHAMAASGENLTGTAVVFDIIRLMLEAYVHDQLTDRPHGRYPTQPAPHVLSRQPPAGPPFADLDPPRVRRDARADVARIWRCHSGDLHTDAPVRNPGPARIAPLRVFYHLSVGAGSLIIDSWAAMVRVIDSWAAMVRVIDSVLAAMRLMRLLVRTCLSYRLNALAFVLVMLAACRHYGHRSEPDDHASLPIRRKLVSMGNRSPA